MTGFTVPSRRSEAERVELARALGDIDMRVFLEGDDGVRVLPHLLGQMAMQVELDADRRLRPDDLAHARQRVAFAIVIPVRDHGAVHEEQHDIDRHGGAQIGEDGVAQFLVHVAERDPGGLREGADAFADLVPVRLARRRHSISGMLPSTGGWRLPSSRKNSRVWKAARPVGIGEKVLVSVASVAMKSFIAYLPCAGLNGAQDLHERSAPAQQQPLEPADHPGDARPSSDSTTMPASRLSVS